MSGRCSCCDKKLHDGEIYFRKVEVDGRVEFILEDLCLVCRKHIFSDSDPDDFDLIGSLGVDVDE